MKRKAFTLIELLVVIAVISILLAIAIPAIQSVRESARRSNCTRNLAEIGKAMTNFYSQYKKFPPSFQVPPGTTVRGSWSIHGRLMPFLDEGNAARQIDLSVDWHSQVGSGIPAHQISTYFCPSDPNEQIRSQDGAPYVASTTYGFNMGTWLIHNPVTGEVSDGPFRVNRGVRRSDINDGISHTLCTSEVKAYTAYIRNATTIDPTLPTSPAHFEGVDAERKIAGENGINSGHTVWPDGRVHHTGFTTVFTPNTKVNYTHDGVLYDIDYNSWQEGRSLTNPTYAAVTSRGYHPAGVNTLMLDGSVEFRSDSIELGRWRALGTIANSD